MRINVSSRGHWQCLERLLIDWRGCALAPGKEKPGSCRTSCSTQMASPMKTKRELFGPKCQLGVSWKALTHCSRSQDISINTTRKCVRHEVLRPQDLLNQRHWRMAQQCILTHPPSEANSSLRNHWPSGPEQTLKYSVLTGNMPFCKGCTVCVKLCSYY